MDKTVGMAMGMPPIEGKNLEKDKETDGDETDGTNLGRTFVNGHWCRRLG